MDIYGLKKRTSFPLRVTKAEISLDALRHNLSCLASRVPNCDLIPAVKADGYGHGANAIADVCESWGAAMLAVANLEEFLSLRDSGIQIPILILENLFTHEVETALEEGARLSVGSMEYAWFVNQEAGRLHKKAILHLNIDTGMGRMGLYSDKPVDDILTIAEMDNTEIEGVFSHFPCSDETDKEFSYQQISLTKHILSEVAARGVKPKYRHIANSGAIIDLADMVSWEMVRPGISIYGLYPSQDVDQSIGLRPVLRLASRLIKITEYNQDWTIGYGRTYSATKGSVIGVVPIGYGDGFPRSLSNRGSALVGGFRVPIVGRISMDMITLDLSKLPYRPELEEEVVLIGSQTQPINTKNPPEEITVEELAELTNTITYEITCDLTPRIPRFYTSGDTVVAVKTYRYGYHKISDF